MKKVRLTQRITSRESESFKRYLEEIREIEKFASVDAEYETALIARNADIRSNDETLSTAERRAAEREREAAITELINRNLRFVVSVAKQYVSQENSLEDLVNEGNYGLVQAARRYDITKGFKFITYAVWWIRRDILAYINTNARIVRLPNNKLTLLSKLKDEVTILEQMLERTPTYNEILEYINIGNAEGEGEYTEADVRFFIESEKENSYSFDKPVNEDDSQTLMSDLFQDTTFGPTDKHLTDVDSQYNINQLLSKLKKAKDRQVITLLFGLDGNEAKSIKEVHEILGVSRERVRQIRENSLKIFREHVK